MTAATPEAPAPRAPSRPAPALLDALVAFVGVLLFQLVVVRHFGVNVPYWDEWFGHLTVIRDAAAGTFGWQELFAQHNEHRLAVARLVFVAAARLLGENNYLALMVCSALLAAATAAIWVYALRRLAFPRAAALASCLVLASAAQHENMLWGFQVQFYTLVLGVLLALAALALRPDLAWGAVALVCLGCLVSTFSIASGLLTWGVLGCCLLLAAWLLRPSPRALLGDRRLLARLGLFAAAALAAGLLFFAGYERVSYHAGLGARDLAQLAGYAARVITFPLLEASGPLPLVLATAQWALIAAGLALYAARRRDPTMRGRLLLTVGVVGFLLANAAALAYGRGNVPEIPSRYATISLWGAALALAVAVDLIGQLAVRPSRRRMAALGLVGLAAGGLLAAQLQVSLAELARLGDERAKRSAMAGSVIAYLRSQSPERQLSGPLPFQPPGPLKAQLDDPALVAQLPHWLLVRAALEQPELDGQAWTLGGAPPEPALLLEPFAWGSWSGNHSRTGALTTAPIRIGRPVLAVPIAGAPAATGTRLVLKTIDAPHLVVAYDGPNPGAQWQTWYVDVSAVQGRDVRLVATDSTALEWFAFAAPYQLTWRAALFGRFMQSIDLIALLVAVGGLLLWLMAAALAPLGPRRRAPLAALAAALALGGALFLTLDGGAPPMAALARDAEFVGLPALLPEGFVETPSLRPVANGLLMHAPGSLELGPATTIAGMCFAARATIDDAAPLDAAADGVEFAAEILVGGRVVRSRAVTVSPRGSASVQLEVPAGQPFAVRLSTRGRGSASPGPAIWEQPELRPCQ